jgi:hypothetical protein
MRSLRGASQAPNAHSHEWDAEPSLELLGQPSQSEMGIREIVMGGRAVNIPSCTSCGGTRWVRYFSETKDGDFEEAFRLCACNYAPVGQVGRGERACGKPEIVLTGRLRLAAHAVTLEICVDPNMDPSVSRPLRGRPAL